MKTVQEIHFRVRVAALRVKCSEKYKMAPEKCHVGHLVLQAMLERPHAIHQIDGVTGSSETNISVAKRSMMLSNAMTNSGMKLGDQVVVMGFNNLDICIPFYASHYQGYPVCCMDPSMALSDLTSFFIYVDPKIVFCPKDRQAHILEALQKNGRNNVRIVVFDDPAYNLNKFVENHHGTDANFQPALFDPSSATCWLMLTSGTTGLPKVAIVPYDTLLNALCGWWCQFTEKWNMTFAMATIQWMSSLLFIISTPLMENVRLQASVPMTPQLLVSLINKYKPNVTAWTPYLLEQFLQVAGNVVDLSSFKYIAIGGSSIGKPLYDKFSEKCGAYLYLVYGMTELLLPVFEFNKNTPFGSVGRPLSQFQYKLVDTNGAEIIHAKENGELWIKGDAFFKGYLNNPEETEKLLTSDGWLKTGDIFYRDDDDFYHFVERKRLLIKHTGFWISPLQLEEVVKQHPGVSDVCVVGIPGKLTETPVAAVVRKNGSNVQAQDIFNLVKKEMPEIKQIHGGLFFVENLPITPSGKVNRAKVKEMALFAPKIMPNK